MSCSIIPCILLNIAILFLSIPYLLGKKGSSISIISIMNIIAIGLVITIRIWEVQVELYTDGFTALLDGGCDQCLTGVAREVMNMWGLGFRV